LSDNGAFDKHARITIPNLLDRSLHLSHGRPTGNHLGKVSDPLAEVSRTDPIPYIQAENMVRQERGYLTSDTWEMVHQVSSSVSDVLAEFVVFVRCLAPACSMEDHVE
jgi:hypothetical protein